jgi:hypothetical protein
LAVLPLAAVAGESNSSSLEFGSSDRKEKERERVEGFDTN